MTSSLSIVSSSSFISMNLTRNNKSSSTSIQAMDTMTKKAQLVFIPAPLSGHLVSTVEMAKLLVHRDHRLSVTFLVMKGRFDSKVITYLDSLSPANNINFIHLPNDDLPDSTAGNVFNSFIESQKPHVKEAVTKLVQNESASGDSPPLAGFVLDPFCTNMMDIADESGVPSYIFYTSGAGFLGLVFYTQELYDEHNKSTAELKDSDTELEIPGFVNPFPVSVLPTVFLEKDLAMVMFERARTFRRAKGIIVNTFMELQSSAIKSLSDGKTNVPPIYPVGPILNLKGDIGSSGSTTNSDIMEWLDDQPPSSVVFLCFGSMGSFSEDQVKEIACALEHSGHRFLWSLRKSPPKDQFAVPSDYSNLTDVLPEGFLDRTAEIGKVIGWAPQASILGHKAIGGFVSHCGWNSTLESIWFGVPMATWPMYAEQQFNAFELVIELGLAVEIKMDYRRNVFGDGESPVLIVSAEEIERGIKKLMVDDSEIRKRMKEMSEKSRKALMQGASSFSALGCFIDDVINNLS